MKRNNKTAAGIGILAAIAIGTVMAVSTPADRTEALNAPETGSESTVWASSPLPMQSTTSTTAVPQIANPVSVEKPIQQVANKTTTTIDATPEIADMGEDFPTPLQVAQAEVGKRGPYADSGFWCAKAVSYFAEQAGVPNWTSHPGPSALWADAMKMDRVHPLPQVGDMGFADLRDPSTRAEYDVQPMHVFIVEAVDGNTIHTIEGNMAGTDVVSRNVRLLDDGMTIAFASFPS